MERLQLTLILTFLAYRTFGQHVELEDLRRDTLTLNNITPTLLWQHYGLIKEEVFEVCNYRDAMGGILTYDELRGLPSLSDSTIKMLKEQLPLFIGTENKQSGELSLRLQPLSKDLISLRLEHNGPGYDAVVRGNPADLQSSIGWSEINIPLAGADTRLLLGQHTLSAGQGLVLSAPAFPSPSSREFFAKGMRGSTSAYSSHSGIGLDLRGRRWHMGGSLDQESFGLCTHREFENGSLGLAIRDSLASVYGKWYKRSWRVFSEAAIHEQVLGINLWQNDILTEWVATRDENGIATAWLMSGRIPNGDWNVSWLTGRLRGTWRQGNWSLQLAQHGSLKTTSAPSFRAVLRYQKGPYRMEHHRHGRTMGILGRMDGNLGSSRFTAMWAACSYGGHPIWLGIPYAPGALSVKAVHANYLGFWASWRNSGWYVRGELDLSEFTQPALSVQFGCSAGLEELAPLIPKIRIALSDYIRRINRDGHQ